MLSLPHLALTPPTPATEPSAPGVEFQELWFALARRHWRTVVLVPCEASFSTNVLATELANVGRVLLDVPVTAVIARPDQYADLAKAIAAAARPEATRAEPSAPAPRMIVAIEPVVEKPLGLALVHAADATILCLEIGRTRVAAVKQSIALIGRDRIAGSIAVG